MFHIVLVYVVCTQQKTRLIQKYSKNLEPTTLFILARNKFPNAPKIYGTIKLQNKEIIAIIERVPNRGNLGEVYWNELNNMINNVFKDVTKKYSDFSKKSNILKVINENCAETLKVSTEIGPYIKNLHKSLTSFNQANHNLKSVKSYDYLKQYTEKLKNMISKLQNYMTEKPESAFFNFSKISSILIDVKDILKRFRRQFKEPNIKIQPVHQDLHLEQILYDLSKGNIIFILSILKVIHNSHLKKK